MGEDGYVQIAGLDLPSVAPRYLEFPMVMGTEENFLLKPRFPKHITMVSYLL